MSAQLDVDIRELVGEMEAPPCETTFHETGASQNHDGGPATHYVMVNCPTCGFHAVKSYCRKFTSALAANSMKVLCPCGAEHLPSDIVTILGPVNA